MTVDDTAPAVAIWRNGRTQKGPAVRTRMLSADAAIAALKDGRDRVFVAPGDADAVKAWVAGAVGSGE